MKVIQRLVVFANCFLMVSAVFAQGERYDLVIAVSEEPATRDKDEIYTDKLITGVDPEAGTSNLPIEFIQGINPASSDAMTEKEFLVNETKPYIYMKIR